MMTKKNTPSNNGIYIIDVGLASKSLVEHIKEQAPVDKKDQVVNIDLSNPLRLNIRK